MLRYCAHCGRERWGTDPCTNPDCPSHRKPKQPARCHGRSYHVTAIVYHPVNQPVCLSRQAALVLR